MAGPRDLTTAVLRFGQMLRAAGLPLTLGELMDGARALEGVDLLDRQDVYLALRTTLVARREEFPAFDRCFDAFWRFQADEGQGLDGLMSPTRRGGIIDMRRSMRANLMKGEIIELRRRERRRRKVRLVLLCDVSGSMDLYSRFLLQFLYALQNVFGRVETFTFSTRLTRVTEHLKGASYRQALAKLTEVRDFSGGTRIGESLQEFNAGWGSLGNRHPIVLVLSDGWDTGEPEILANEMLAIKRKAGRLIWLNPLLGNPSYEPLTRGMAAALPLVDHFAAAHNLASLRDLASHLNLR